MKCMRPSPPMIDMYCRATAQHQRSRRRTSEKNSEDMKTEHRQAREERIGRDARHLHDRVVRPPRLELHELPITKWQSLNSSKQQLRPHRTQSTHLVAQ